MSNQANSIAIKNSLSAARIGTYEAETLDLDAALKLYQWNADISGTFLPSLHICEVTIRNAVSLVLEQVYGNRWAWEHVFISSLPNPKYGYNARKDLKNACRGAGSIGKVIPELKFVFWQKMFTSRHDGRLWNTYLEATFPNLDNSKTIQERREIIYNDLEQIRALRNRIAHHEPIFKRALANDYEKIKSLVEFRCLVTSSWLSASQKILPLIAEKP
jgi:hypothetical protein